MPRPTSSDRRPRAKKARAPRAARRKSPPPAQKKKSPTPPTPETPHPAPIRNASAASAKNPPKKKPAPKRKSRAKKSPAPAPAQQTLNPRALSRLDLVAVITATRVTSLSSATIGNWVASGCPRNADGSFDIVTIAAWLAAERRNRATSTAKESKALERFREARAKLSELELKIRTGELVQSHVVEDQCREIGLTLRNAFASIERRHGRAIGDEIRSALDTAFRKMQITEAPPRA